jgi:hypothetical protein
MTFPSCTQFDLYDATGGSQATSGVEGVGS